MWIKPIFNALNINTIIAKYLRHNIWVLLLAIFAIITLVVFGNQLVLVIKESLKHGIPTADLFSLIGFKIIADVPLVLSLSLFLAIILSISKLYKNSEAVIMNAIGLGERNFILFIQPVVIVIFVFILFLTAVVVPWSKAQKNSIMERTKSSAEFSFIKQDEFQTFKNGNIVFYASKAKADNSSDDQEMEAVFIYALVAGEPIITLAKYAQRYTDSVTNSVYLRLKEGRRYYGFLGNNSRDSKKVLDFDLYDLQIIDSKQQNAIADYNKVEAVPTLDLLDFNSVDKTAELQQRFVQPFSVLILSALGVLLGKTAPRGGKNLGVLVGVVIFILYNNALLIFKSDHGQVEYPVLGIWWVHILMLVFIFSFYAYRHGKFEKLFGKISRRFSTKDAIDAKPVQ